MRRLTGRSRKAKPCTEINSGVTSDLYWIIYPVCSPLDSINVVMSQSRFYLKNVSVFKLIC
ncbi:hypothetical protein [Priestia megaterium]|uniref:hypothetical protein n=1 Tax=Priestia megaterium TaxID=1404 RepID=UPI0011586769|nr:hypothetical protein [Priestia megaterium]